MNPRQCITIIALLTLAKIGRADPLEHWTWRNPVPTGETLNAVAYGHDLFVAVGGTIVTSPDGVSWVERSSGPAPWLYSIAFGNNQFAAVGDGDTILTSSDGINWTNRSSGLENSLRSVAWGGGQFVTVGLSGVIETSPDGVNWTLRSSDANIDLLAWIPML
jgi:hypothetical protein